MNLAIPVLPRLKACIRIVSGHIVYKFDLIPDIYGSDWIGSTVRCEDPDGIGLDCIHEF